MSTILPVYTNLLKEVQSNNKPLLVREKLDFVKKIDLIDKNGIEIIYAMIILYAKDHDKESLTPYDIKNVNNRIEFNLINLPPKLSRLLYKFSELHISTMN